MPMPRYVFGFDKSDPVNCARALKSRDITAVVTDISGSSLAEALMQEGLDVYLCYVAHPLNARETQPCQDVFGHSRIWFASGCPNDESLAQRHLNAVLQAIRPGIKGVLVDGARFASFASPEGLDAFLTGFCPRCLRRMDEMGLDIDAIQGAVRALRNPSLPINTEGFQAFLSFRSQCVQSYMDHFARTIHAVSPTLKAGAFIFDPFLAPFVGQTMLACKSLDIIAPMIYRRYPYDQGPACLNHEWAQLRRLMGDRTDQYLSLAGVGDTPLSIRSRTADEILKSGFEPEQVFLSIKKARSLIRPHQFLWPILQLEDTSVKACTDHAFAAGADAVGYFAYGQGELPE